jgi:hypothetical protein
MLGGFPPSARLLGIGFYVGTCIVMGVLGGSVLDGWLETGKTFTIAGLFAGLVLALYGGFLQLMEVLHDIERRRKAGKKD